MSFQSVLKNRHDLQCDWPRWTGLDYCECEEIQSGTVQYSNILIKMPLQLRGKVSKIAKVNSPFLSGSFLIRKAEYASRGYPNCVHELFHATGASCINSILKKNLDWRRVSRAKFGRGVSFSNDPAYANQEASRSIGSSRAMIVADVLVGSTTTGSDHYFLPPGGADTTTGRSKVYVKYYDDEFCPKYIIYYEHEHVRRNFHRRGVPKSVNIYVDDSYLTVRLAITGAAKTTSPTTASRGKQFDVLSTACKGPPDNTLSSRISLQRANRNRLRGVLPHLGENNSRFGSRTSPNKENEAEKPQSMPIRRRLELTLYASIMILVYYIVN